MRIVGTSWKALLKAGRGGPEMLGGGKMQTPHLAYINDNASHRGLQVAVGHGEWGDKNPTPVGLQRYPTDDVEIHPACTLARCRRHLELMPAVRTASPQEPKYSVACDNSTGA